MITTMNFQSNNRFLKYCSAFSKSIKMIQSRIGFILILAFMSFSNLTFSQIESKETLINYKASDEAIAEIKSLLLNDKAKIEIAMRYVADMEVKHKIVLSSAEYAPIKAKCDRLSPNLPIEEYTEIKAYAHMVSDKYVVVTRIIQFDYEIR